MLSRTEAIEILDELAREGPDHVRVAAVRLLLQLNDDKGGERPLTAFDELDQLAARREKKGLRPAP